MRIAIVAPGAVGGYFGVLLARSGENVGALARGAHLDAIAEHGLIAEGPRGTFSARLDASDDAAKLGEADIVLFAVKLYGAAEAARSAVPLFGPQTLGISLLNGIDGHEIMGRELPGHTVVGGSAYVSSVIAAPGKLRYTSDMSAINFGAPADAALRAKATAFIDSCSKAGFKADMVDDVMSSLWEKFIGLSTNAALTTAARLPAGPLYGDPDVMEVARALMQEAAAVARAAGAKLPGDIVERHMTILLRLPAGMYASMYHDYAKGGPIEIEGMSGYIVREGRRFGVPTPHHATIYALLKPHRAGTPGT
jgi:2-dehydropantoate 2-reductase